MGFEDKYIYTSTDVAMYLVALANNKRITINITKVQKLLYITYGTFLRVYKKRLINEHPQAWPYGPVFPTTRNKLLKQDLTSISKESISEEEQKKMDNDNELNNVFEFVFENFGTWNAGQLSEWSHTNGSPWENISKKERFRWGDIIPDNLIYDYFCSIINLKSKS